MASVTRRSPSNLLLIRNQLNTLSMSPKYVDVVCLQPNRSYNVRLTRRRYICEDSRIDYSRGQEHSSPTNDRVSLNQWQETGTHGWVANMMVSRCHPKAQFNARVKETPQHFGHLHPERIAENGTPEIERV